MSNIRIIGGQWRGRKLDTPKGQETRPTLGFVREALFNILGERVVGTYFADVYAGSGAVGLEALSRGAARATFIESARSAIAAIRANCERLEVSRAETTTIECRVGQAAARIGGGQPIDILFADPPYPKKDDAAITPEFLKFVAAAPLAVDALIIIQAPPEAMPPEVPGWEIGDTRRYGRSALYFLERNL